MSARHLVAVPALAGPTRLTVADLPPVPRVAVVANPAEFGAHSWLIDGETIYLRGDLDPTVAPAALAEAFTDYLCNPDRPVLHLLSDDTALAT